MKDRKVIKYASILAAKVLPKGTAFNVLQRTGTKQYAWYYVKTLPTQYYAETTLLKQEVIV